MATERLSMRQTREILRQKWRLGRTHREVAQSLGISCGASRSISPHGWQGILASIVLSPSSTASSNSVKTMVSQSLVTDAGRRRVTPALDGGGGDAGSFERTTARSFAAASSVL